MTRTRRYVLLWIGIPVFILIVVIVILGFLNPIRSETLTENQSVALHYATMTDYDLADWDTVFVVIKEADNTIIDTVGLAHTQPGRWYGLYSCALLSGGYVREYYAVYSGDTTMEVYPFSVIPEATLQGSGSLGTGSDTLRIWAKVGVSMYPDIMLTVKNTSEAKLWNALTLGDGHRTFNVNPGIYKVYPSGGRVNWDSTYITCVVPSGGLVDTVTGSAFSPSAPSEANACSLYTWIGNVGISPEIGATLEWGFESGQNRIQTTTGKYVGTRVRSSKSNAAGYVGGQTYWGSVLKAQDDNGNAVDSVRIWIKLTPTEGEVFERRNWVVPDATTYDLKNLFTY